MAKQKGPRCDRLLILADHLETKVLLKRFNMDVWHEQTECGTVACALGHACEIPSFKKAGLYLHKVTNIEVPWIKNLQIPSDIIYSKFDTIDNFAMGIIAGERFFGISKSHSEYLFDTLEYPRGRRGPKSVAKRIRKLVKKLQNS